MISLGGKKMLGIALGERSLALAEVVLRGEGFALTRASVMDYPREGLSDPVVLGQTLKGLLRHLPVSSRHVVFGLPARWVISRRKEIPPADAQTAAATLRLAAESDFASEAKDLAVDYAGDSSVTAGASVLLVATSQERLVLCREIAKAADLRIKAVMPTGPALVGLASSPEERLLISLSVTGSELVLAQGSGCTHLRHLGLSNGQCQDAAAVAGELRRAIAALPGAGKPRRMTLWAERGETLARQLATSLNMPITEGHFAVAEPHSSAACAPAVAVALAELRKEAGGVNFLKSRLTPKARRFVGRPLVLAAIAASVPILLIGGAMGHLQHQRDQLSQINAHLRDSDAEIAKARTGAERLKTARGWIGQSPRVVAALSELTRLFPDEGSIWATSVSLRQDMAGQLAGKASNEQQVLNLLDRMKDSRRFGDLKLLDMRDAGKNSREIAFSISFVFRAEAL